MTIASDKDEKIYREINEAIRREATANEAYDRNRTKVALAVYNEGCLNTILTLPRAL